ncbi:hypothetical protein HOU14_gp31 [Dickeya phage Luksen]|uniref:Uncharacterized protein n=1 Tax=Dickeya phage Luksen TaxID=2320192 RepID=A0A385IG79_9CAUD|nr:hypothetical protein HOU14_gp31 [Dickeya phage Luksen]AXY81856.1 hypothetical protein [Dickeya phage Luksen]
MKPEEILKTLCDALTEEPWISELPDELGFILVGNDDWVDEGKYQSLCSVVKHEESGLYFEATFSRHGDHWQGHETEFDGACQVEPVQVMVTQYRRVS